MVLFCVFIEQASLKTEPQSLYGPFPNLYIITRLLIGGEPAPTVKDANKPEYIAIPASVINIKTVKARMPIQIPVITSISLT